MMSMKQNNEPEPMKSIYSQRDAMEGHGTCLEEVGCRFKGYYYCNTCRLCNEVLPFHSIGSRTQRTMEGVWGGGIGGFCEFDSRAKLVRHWDSDMCFTNAKLLEMWLQLNQKNSWTGIPIEGYKVISDRCVVEQLTGDKKCPAVIRKI